VIAQRQGRCRGLNQVGSSPDETVSRVVVRQHGTQINTASTRCQQSHGDDGFMILPSAATAAQGTAILRHLHQRMVRQAGYLQLRPARMIRLHVFPFKQPGLPRYRPLWPSGRPDTIRIAKHQHGLPPIHVTALPPLDTTPTAASCPRRRGSPRPQSTFRGHPPGTSSSRRHPGDWRGPATRGITP